MGTPRNISGSKPIASDAMHDYCYSVNVLKKTTQNFINPDNETWGSTSKDYSSCAICGTHMILGNDGYYKCLNCGFDEGTTLESCYQKTKKQVEEISGKPIEEVSMAVGKDNLPKEMPEDDSLDGIAAFIEQQFRVEQQFSNKAEFLHFFFIRTDRYTQKQFCLQNITGLPSFQLRPIKTKFGYDIGFNAIWSADSGTKIQQGWDAVPGKHSYKSYKTNIKGFMHLPQVKSLNAYNWGFEIIAHGGVNMFAIMHYALNPSADINTVEDMITADSWAVPLKPEFRLSKSIRNWMDTDPDKSVEIDKIIAESTGISPKIQIRNVGQRKVEIDIDAD